LANIYGIFGGYRRYIGDIYEIYGGHIGDIPGTFQEITRMSAIE